MPGILDAEMPWMAKLMALFLSSIPELGMGRGYHRTPSMETGSPFAATNEMQDVMHRAQQEETVAPAQFNPWMMQNIPDWIVPQDPTYAEKLYPHMGGQLGTAMKAGPGEYGIGDIQNLFGALQDPYVHKGIPRRHEPLRVVAPEVTTAQERARTGREEVAGVLEEHGIGTSLEALNALRGVFGQEGMKTIVPSMYPEEAPDRTAYDRNLELQERNRLEYMSLRDKFDEGSMFTGSPQEFAKFKVLEGQFREETTGEETTGMILQEYIRYVAAWQKQDPSTKALAGQPLTWPEYQAQFKMGGGEGSAGAQTFHGASSYEEVEQIAGTLQEPERTRLLTEARAFFGVK